jgi:hypothetical protein
MGYVYVCLNSSCGSEYHRSSLSQSLFFLKRRQKFCLNLLIKKKRIAQLINGNRAKTAQHTHKRTTPKTWNWLTLIGNYIMLEWGTYMFVWIPHVEVNITKAVSLKVICMISQRNYPGNFVTTLLSYLLFILWLLILWRPCFECLLSVRTEISI